VQKLLVASTNRGKLREIEEILRGVPFHLITLAEFPECPAPDETGRTFAENAREKAIYYAQATGELTVAEDSGLEIDALGGAPGIESARYAGADASYPRKFAMIYDALRSKGANGSAARFVCALAVVRGSQVLFETEGMIEGQLADKPKGERGFGYDPIFYYPPFAATLAEVEGERKSSVSHRGRAFAALKRWLKAQGSCSVRL